MANDYGRENFRDAFPQLFATPGFDTLAIKRDNTPKNYGNELSLANSIDYQWLLFANESCESILLALLVMLASAKHVTLFRTLH